MHMTYNGLLNKYGNLYYVHIEFLAYISMFVVYIYCSVLEVTV